LIANGLLIIQTGSDIHGGQIVGLDPGTGVEKWTWNGPGPGYASPMLLTISGIPQIVTLTDSSIVSLDATNGRQLWTSEFPDEWHENIATPLWTGKFLVVSGPRQGTHAYTIAMRNGSWQVAKAWSNTDVTMYMSSPVEGDGLIYGLSSKRRGQFVALNGDTGAIKWATEGREGEHASILLTPSHLLYLTNQGQVVIARRGKENFEVERKYEIGTAETWAVPVLLPQDLLIRDASALTRFAGRR
jgi:outer membrane protein assembly factor BamB